MMTNRFEDLWNSADDGASTPISPLELHHDDEASDLLDAWFLERQNSLAFEILLDESRKMLRRLVAEAEVSTEARKSARRLIKAISETLRHAQTGED